MGSPQVAWALRGMPAATWPHCPLPDTSIISLNFSVSRPVIQRNLFFLIYTIHKLPVDWCFCCSNNNNNKNRQIHNIFETIRDILRVARDRCPWNDANAENWGYPFTRDPRVWRLRRSGLSGPGGCLQADFETSRDLRLAEERRNLSAVGWKNLGCCWQLLAHL